MKAIRKLIGVWSIILCMLGSSASASMLGLDGALTQYLDLNGEVRFSYNIEAQTLLPFGEATLVKLNALLKHISVDASVITDTEGSTSTMQIVVANENMLDLTEQQSASGSMLQSSLLPNRTLNATGSAMDALSDSKAEEPASFDALQAFSEAQGCYKVLTDAIAPFAEEKKASYSIKGIGAARWSRIARLTEAQSAQLSPMIAAVLSCGMDAAYRTQLESMTYQKGFVVALYQEAQGGKDMAVYMKGNVLMADGTTRKLAYQWAFKDDGVVGKDTFKFELITAKKPSDNRVISASYTQQHLTDHFSVVGNSETVLKSSTETVTTTLKHDLSGQDKDGVRDLTGTVSTTVNTAAANSSRTATSILTPKLKLTSAEGSGVLSGTVAVEEKEGKKVLKELLFTFSEEPAKMLASDAASGELFAVSDLPTSTVPPMPESSLLQNEDVLDTQSKAFLVGENPIGLQTYTVPDSMQAVNLDTITAEQRGILLQELSQNLAARLLKVVAKLPAEDITLITDGMTDADAASLIAMLEGL